MKPLIWLQRIIFFTRLFLIYSWIGFLCIVFLFVAPFIWRNLKMNVWFTQLSSRFGQRILGYKIDVEGMEHLKALGMVGSGAPTSPCVFVANHQSYVDFFTIGALFPHRTVCIGKRELVYLPIFGFLFYAAGNILINRQNKTSASASIRGLIDEMQARSVSAWIFPEGTRSHGRVPLLPFK